MFKINNNQLTDLSLKFYNDFVLKMQNHLKEIFKEFVVETDDELKTFIENCIGDASKYNIYLESDLEFYLELCYCYDIMKQNKKNQIIINILHHPTETGRNKLLYLYNYLKAYTNESKDYKNDVKNEILNDIIETIV